MKLLRLIGLMVLLLTFWQTGTCSFAADAADVEPFAVDGGEFSIVEAHHSQLPAAELSHLLLQCHFSAHARAIRMATTQHLLSSHKESVNKLAVQLSNLKRYHNNLSVFAPVAVGGPVCQYYIFALRRILI